jgi:ADP-ribose pyrophosphatase
MKAWRTIASRPVFEHRWYRVDEDTVELGDGAVIRDYLVGRGPDVALICALTPGNEIVLVRQWKQGIREFTLELPGGFIEDGEEGLVAAIRELAEETGYCCRSVSPLGRLAVDPTKSSRHVSLFLGRSCEPVSQPRLDDAEAIDVVVADLAEAVELVNAGAVVGAASAAGILLAAQRCRTVT